MRDAYWRWGRIVLAIVGLLIVAIAVGSGAWTMFHGRPGPGLLFAVSALSGAGAARTLLFD